jgi:hypothetical protein
MNTTKDDFYASTLMVERAKTNSTHSWTTQEQSVEPLKRYKKTLWNGNWRARLTLP